MSWHLNEWRQCQNALAYISQGQMKDLNVCTYVCVCLFVVFFLCFFLCVCVCGFEIWA